VFATELSPTRLTPIYRSYTQHSEVNSVVFLAVGAISPGSNVQWAKAGRLLSYATVGFVAQQFILLIAEFIHWWRQSTLNLGLRARH
jgi:hypothetical protein